MEQIINLLFGYWYKAPLLFSTFDWAMCVGQLELLKWCIDTLKGGTNAKTRGSNKNRL